MFKKLTFADIGKMHFLDLATGIEGDEIFDPSAIIGAD